jgi:hypothetical protein
MDLNSELFGVSTLREMLLKNFHAAMQSRGENYNK